MRPYISRALLALALLAPASLDAQEMVSLTAWCSYDGQEIETDIYGFASDAEARDALARVMEHTGLTPNFDIRAANVPNAMAGIEGSRRLILYNQSFMRDVRNRTNTDWAAVSILAHEIGHHLNGHTLERGGSRPPIELEADRFSGFVLFRMGATLDEAKAAMNTIASDQGSATHPPRSARLAAITNGYIAAQQGAPRPGPNPSPNPAPGPAPTTPPVPQPGNNFVARVVFPADPVAYFVTSDDQIVAINPQTNQRVVVGRRIPPTVPGFVWMYSTQYGSYGVTADGRVWNRDPAGNVFQVGYVTTQ